VISVGGALTREARARRTTLDDTGAYMSAFYGGDPVMDRLTREAESQYRAGTYAEAAA
jgi:hypothetical protein